MRTIETIAIPSYQSTGIGLSLLEALVCAVHAPASAGGYYETDGATGKPQSTFQSTLTGVKPTTSQLILIPLA